ncbi:50S ribosomal protein L18 [Candidatus Micrarchaeota archaeon]|nr:50S ribosomal protein L18 [Candidatus Micrarchaeota archaeon]
MTKATGPIYAVHFRRRTEGRTDYEKRLAHLKSRKYRMVVRKTNKYIIVEFANFDLKGDQVVTSSTSRALLKIGYPGKSNTPSAYLVGLLCAKNAMKKGVTEAVLDIGLHPATKGSLIFAALKGAIDAGIKIPYSEEILPSKERIEGTHLKGESNSKFNECKEKILKMQ